MRAQAYQGYVRTAPGDIRHSGSRFRTALASPSKNANCCVARQSQFRHVLLVRLLIGFSRSLHFIVFIQALHPAVFNDQNRPETLPVFTSTSTRRKAGLEAVPGMRLIVPAQGHRNFAPE